MRADVGEQDSVRYGRFRLIVAPRYRSGRRGSATRERQLRHPASLSREKRCSNVLRVGDCRRWRSHDHILVGLTALGGCWGRARVHDAKSRCAQTMLLRTGGSGCLLNGSRA